MTAVPQAGARPAAREGFSSLAEAEAWLGGLHQRIGSLPPAGLTETVLRLERLYDRFPELTLAFPRRALLREFRAAAAARPDREALPLLLLCAAAEPSDSAALASLFERAARAGGTASLSSLLRLFRPYRDLGGDEIDPAMAALVDGGAGAAAILDSAAAVLDGMGEGETASSRLLASLICPEAGAAANPAALLRGAAGARRRLGEAETSPDREGQQGRVLALAERLRDRLQPPAPPRRETPLAWPGGEIAFPSFVAQWPELAIEIPASQLLAGYAALDANGTLRAERHKAGAFCHGPYLTLPAGRYRVRIIGEAAAGAEYVAQAACSLEDRGPVSVGEQRYVRDNRVTGAIAELAFASDIELRNFEVIVTVASPGTALAIEAIAVTAEGLRPDPDD